MTELLGNDDEGIFRAARLLAGGGTVAFPTETVYGLGADATDPAAVARIYAAKGRPAFNPLIVHVADIAAARALVRFDPVAEALAGAFWPGALSLVLPLREDAGVAGLVTAGLPTLAVRVPDHPLASVLLHRTGRPIAAPSANLSGRISPTTAAHVLATLDGQIDAVIDGGACPVGVESTVVAVTDGQAVLLREGGVPAEEIARAAGGLTVADGTPERPISPGQLASHYAPAAGLRVDAASPRENEIWIGFGPDCGGAALNLSPRGDLREAAAILYACLYRADAMAASQGAAVISVAPVPMQGIGRAINDRLSRAAAPRQGVLPLV